MMKTTIAKDVKAGDTINSGYFDQREPEEIITAIQNITPGFCTFIEGVWVKNTDGIIFAVLDGYTFCLETDRSDRLTEDGVARFEKLVDWREFTVNCGT